MAEIRLLLDENMPLSLARQLRSRGIDAVAVEERGEKGLSDERVISLARETGRAIVTLDKHFTDIERDHTGVMYFTRPVPIGGMIRAIEGVIDAMEDADIEGTVQYLPWK